MNKMSDYKSQEANKESVKNIDTIFSDKEKLWKYFFGSEYKPETKIDFQKIKDYINKNKEENSRRVLRDYNYNMGSPQDLCDYLIHNNLSDCSITSFDSLSDNQKRCLADIFLELFPFDQIKERLGTAMLFWIRHYGYYYSNKRREKLKEYLINSSGFFSSEDDFNILERSFESQNRINKYTKQNIKTTLLGYILEKNLQENLDNKNINQYLKQILGPDFSFQKFTPRHNYSSGKEKDRYRKDVEKDGNIIEREKIDRTSKYIKEKIRGKEKSLEVADHQNNDIYSDRSGKIYKIFLDGPLSIGLFHKNNPIALISFSVKDPETIFINQMQAVSSDNIDRYGRMIGQSVDPVIKKIDWQESLYDVVNILARKYGFKNIIIQSGENNKWINEYREVLEYDNYREDRRQAPTDIPHLSLDIANKIYDTFAKNHGFKTEKISKNRKKKI